MEDLLQLPFQFIRIPNLKLRLPKISKPSAMVVFGILFVSYFLVLSGLIYDVIVEPPSVGMTRDEVTGATKPQAILMYRVNGQYIIEGLAAGLLFAMGGAGFILLDFANKKATANKNRYLLFLGGSIFIFAAYNLCIVFMRMKVPGKILKYFSEK